MAAGRHADKDEPTPLAEELLSELRALVGVPALAPLAPGEPQKTRRRASQRHAGERVSDTPEVDSRRRGKGTFGRRTVEGHGAGDARGRAIAPPIPHG